MNTREPISPSLTLDLAVLTRAVCAALGRSASAIERWQVRPVGAGAGAATQGVYRVSGTATDGGTRLDWALILKIIRPAAAAWNPAAREIDHPIYWETRPKRGLGIPRRQPSFHDASGRPTACRTCSTRHAQSAPRRPQSLFSMDHGPPPAACQSSGRQFRAHSAPDVCRPLFGRQFRRSAWIGPLAWPCQFEYRDDLYRTFPERPRTAYGAGRGMG